MLASGSGTILEAVLEAGVGVAIVLADRPCRALELASAAGVEALLLDRRAFGGFGPAFDRARYTDVLTETLTARDVDLIAMAGFGTVLAGSVHDAFGGRILNTHPSLLPAFPGWHAVADALAAGVVTTGCTVHLAVTAVDAGPVLAQEAVPVQPGDTEATLHERIKRVERRLYPATILRVLGELEAAGAEARPA
ncbi:MAG TPA: phosphoribosylglycinamide formyltransferase [Acidimicrobiales bacterium]|nr:phosphoribosylglycinamide formyltransferase [Acidimicrobiales bacterium]